MATRLARYVSLIPFEADAVNFAARYDLWSDNADFLACLQGDEEEHAVLLVSYFLTLDIPAPKLLFGYTISDGNCCWVVTLDEIDSQVRLWDPLTGESYSPTDPKCPLQAVYCAADASNIYYNVQSKFCSWFHVTTDSFRRRPAKSNQLELWHLDKTLEWISGGAANSTSIELQLFSTRYESSAARFGQHWAVYQRTNQKLANGKIDPFPVRYFFHDETNFAEVWVCKNGLDADWKHLGRANKRKIQTVKSGWLSAQSKDSGSGNDWACGEIDRDSQIKSIQCWVRSCRPHTAIPGSSSICLGLFGPNYPTVKSTSYFSTFFYFRRIKLIFTLFDIWMQTPIVSVSFYMSVSR